MRPTDELRQIAAFLLQELKRYDARDQQAIMALLSKPENFQKRVSARNYWIRAYFGHADGNNSLEKARKMASEWSRYLVSARWRIDRQQLLLPPDTEFPYWHLHAISKLNEEKALCEKQILNIIK